MKEPDWDYFYNSSLNRMKRLIAMEAPPVIVVNEARTILRTAEHGPWRAIRRWAWNEISRTAGDLWFDIRVFCHSTFRGISQDEATSLLLNLDDRRYEQRLQKERAK